MVLVAKIMDFSYSNAAEEEENIVTLCSKSLRLLLHFGEVVGLDEVFDELFEVFGFEANEFDRVKTVLFCDDVVDFVFLDEPTNLFELFFRAGLDGCVHIDVYLTS